MVSQAGMPRYVLAFLHLRQPSSLLHLGKRDFGQNDVVASSKLRLLLVVGNVVPSLGSGDTLKMLNRQ